MSQRWKESLLLPLYKKRNKSQCSNCRGIAILDVMYKVLASCINDRIQKYMETTVGDYQAEFRINRSVVDQLHTLKRDQVYCHEYDIALRAIFIDFKQAYDTEEPDDIRSYECLIFLVN